MPRATGFQLAGAGFDRACEGAVGIAEQLAFDEGIGKFGAAYLDKRPFAVHPDVVKGLGHKLLPRAALAANDHCGVHVRQGLDATDQALHHSRFAHEISDAPPVLQAMLQPGQSLLLFLKFIGPKGDQLFHAVAVTLQLGFGGLALSDVAAKDQHRGPTVEFNAVGVDFQGSVGSLLTDLFGFKCAVSGFPDKKPRNPFSGYPLKPLC